MCDIIRSDSEQLPNLLKKVQAALRKIDKETYSCAWTVTGSKLKTGNCCGPKQREQPRTLTRRKGNYMYV